MIWTWLQRTPVYFRLLFSLTATTMAGGFLFNFIGHDGIGALLGLAGGIALIVVKRDIYFGPRLR